MFQNWNIVSSFTKTIFSNSVFSSPFVSNPFAKDIIARFKAKKAGSCTRNKGGRPKPKHRGPKVQANRWVPQGKMLFLQRRFRMHPGLNVGLGRNLTLYALSSGTFVTSCEKFDPNWNIGRVNQSYAHRKGETILKKYCHVIPDPQPNRFNLIHLI